MQNVKNAGGKSLLCLVFSSVAVVDVMVPDNFPTEQVVNQRPLHAYAVGPGWLDYRDVAL